jgi:crotonobetainyl-CoA:carnitine CoA-transferase CaiB-like acyl-CoA transferase
MDQAQSPGVSASAALKPLEGVRVLTLEQFASAPYGTMFLADLGAQVIKVENAATGGDAARHAGPYRLGAADSEYFQGWNLNKRSVLLDLEAAEDRAAFEQLVAGSHAVVNNLRGDVPAKLRIDYASLRAVNPAIVCLHISAYGRDNERAGRPGYDYLMQAEAGLMSLTGEPDGPPARFGTSTIDYMSGMTGVVGLLACLLRARETGKGCDIDVSLFDVALHQLNYVATWYLNEGLRSSRTERSAHFAVGPVETYPTANGWVYLMCMTEKFWRELLEGLGRTELASDPRFATPELRHRHREALRPCLESEFVKRPTAHWLDLLGQRLPIAPVHDLAQALESPFVARTGMISQVRHPARPSFKVLANPLKFNGERLSQAVCSPLGADTEALLGARRTRS